MVPLLVIFLLTFPTNNVNSLSIPIISDIQDIIGIAGTVQDLISGNVPFADVVTGGPDPIATVLGKLDDISKQIQKLGDEILDKMDNMLETLLVRIPDQIEITAAMRDFSDQIIRIDSLYDDFDYYVDSGEDYNNVTIDSFVKSVTSNDGDDLPDALNKMHRLFVPQRSATIRESLMKLLAKGRNYTEERKLCNTPYSFQERLFEIFNIITVSEIRGYIMTLFAYDVLAYKKRASFAREVEKATSKYVLRVEEYILVTQKKMAAAQRNIFRCDPTQHIAGETYVELEGAIQGYLINEEQTNSGQSCGGTCSDINTEHIYKSCYVWYEDGGQFSRGRRNEFCPIRGCSGVYDECHSVGDTSACTHPKSSIRRYKYIYVGHGIYGSAESGCWASDDDTQQVLKSITEGFNRCDACFCRCVEQDYDSIANRTLSLRPQISNIAENMIMSNVRFTQKNKLIHIQIEEAPLLGGGTFNPNDTRWAQLEDLEYVAEKPNGAFVLVENGEKKTLKKDKDYAFITKQQRHFNLDSINIPDNYIMTGVRMNHEDPSDPRSAIQVEIYATPFDYHEGKLTESAENPSIWVTAKTQPHPDPRYVEEKRPDLDLGKRIPSTKSYQNYDFSQVNSKVAFYYSNVFADASQSTVPFFDAQPVGINRQRGFGGLEVFHRSTKDHAGFIAMKLFTLDISIYMNPVMLKKQLKKYKKLYRQNLAYAPPTK